MISTMETVRDKGEKRGDSLPLDDADEGEKESPLWPMEWENKWRREVAGG